MHDRRTRRTVLISGATKGIGRALSDRLLADGWNVVGIARHFDPSFTGRLVVTDLADQDATEATLAGLCTQHRFDAVVNNAGAVRPQPLGMITHAALQEVFDVNVGAAIALTQATLAHMHDSGWGRIVNVASLVVLGAMERSAYAAAKAALIALTKTWALELADTGITVNAVAPGPTETKLFRDNNPSGSVGEQRYLTAVPMRRFGRPDEIAAAIAYFLGEDSSFVTGQTLFVDGGASLGRATR